VLEVVESQQPTMWPEADFAEREPEPSPANRPIKREARLKPVDRNQLLLRTVDVDKLVERDHLVRAMRELTGRLDLGDFTANVESVEGMAGRPAYASRLLISLWVCTSSIFSSW